MQSCATSVAIRELYCVLLGHFLPALVSDCRDINVSLIPAASHCPCIERYSSSLAPSRAQQLSVAAPAVQR
jgi:hypothetical protein